MTESTNEGNDAKRKNRSPNHPSFDLETAIGKVASLHKQYGKAAAPLKAACEKMGYSTINSSSNSAVATMKSFGLILVTGKGDERKIAVSDEGDRIVRGSPDKKDLIRVAALAPKLHSELWNMHKDEEILHNDILHQYLVWDRTEGTCFNEDAVDAFIANFRSTLAYAGVTSDGKNGNSEEGDGTVDDILVIPSIGAFVQWTSQGVDQFPAPYKVVAVSDDGDYAFVAESQTGIPMSELTVADPPDGADVGRQPPPNPLYKPPSVEDQLPRDFAKERLTLDEGPVVIQWPSDIEAASVHDLEDWLDVLIKRLKRRAGIDEQTGKSSVDE